MLCANSEDVPVSLPRLSSGEVNPILKYMDKSCRAPLVISISERIDCETKDDSSEIGSERVESEQVESERVESEQADSEQADSEQADSEFETENDQFHEQPRRMTVSEFARPRMVIVQEEEEEEEEEEETILPPELDAHFLARPPQIGSFSTYHIPVLCMADCEPLPVLMAALLHQ